MPKSPTPYLPEFRWQMVDLVRAKRRGWGGMGQDHLVASFQARIA